jgi:hypothetical protein
LETTFDGGIEGEIKDELFTSVSWVSLESSKDLSFLTAWKIFSRDNCNLLFLVQSFVELNIFISNNTNLTKSLVVGQDLQEFDSQRVEISEFLKSNVHLAHLSFTNTSVLCELLERFTVFEKSLDVNDIFVNIEKGSLGRGSSEKNFSISSGNGIILEWWLVTFGRLNLLNITNWESSEEWFVNGISSLDLSGTSKVSWKLFSFWWWWRSSLNWSSLNYHWFFDNFSGFFFTLSLGSIRVSLLGSLLLLSERSHLGVKKVLLVNDISLLDHSNLLWSSDEHVEASWIKFGKEHFSLVLLINKYIL